MPGTASPTKNEPNDNLCVVALKRLRIASETDREIESIGLANLVLV